MSEDGDCSFVIAFYSISFQYPGQDHKTLQDVSHSSLPPDQAVTVALVGSPGPDKTAHQAPLPPSDPKRQNHHLCGHLSRLDSPGPDSVVILQDHVTGMRPSGYHLVSEISASPQQENIARMAK